MPAEWRGTTSASRVFHGHGYQLSDDLQRRSNEVLERRYGGRLRANHAATVIQRAYRQYRINRHWREMTTPMHERLSQMEMSHQQRTGGGGGGPRPIRPHNGRVHAVARMDLGSRYLPQTSLSAQLRAEKQLEHSRRAATAADYPRDSRLLRPDRIGCRSPPSPSPAPRSMIDSLMSPRLVARRMPCDGGGGGGGQRNGHALQPAGSLSHLQHSRCAPQPSVWIPRGLAQSNPNHSNSLPRLQKKREVVVADSHPQPGASEKPAPRPLTELERKRQYRIALNFFNKKPERGVRLLLEWGFVDGQAESLARLLFGRRGLSRKMVGEYLGVLHSPFHATLLETFISLIDVRGLEVDSALRRTLNFFHLPGEAQKIERIMQVFAAHYARSNPQRMADFAGGEDTVFILSFAIIMLNTDQHSRSLKAANRMKRDDFVKNLRGVDQGECISRKLLEDVFDRVKQDEFRPGDDHVAQVAQLDASIAGKDKPKLSEPHRRLVCYCRLQQVADPQKRQAVTAHERDVFLFNDMLVVTKCSSRRRQSTPGSADSYQLKCWLPLLGAAVEMFSRGQYDCGLSIAGADGTKIVLNARNSDDRVRFVADVRESMAECSAMEAVRLDMELDRDRGLQAVQRDSGLPEEGVAGVASGRPSPSGGRPSPPGTHTRRLSFHSLDSGVVEEGFDVSA